MRAKYISKYVPLSHKEIPLLLERVQAGFPSPADDYIEKVLDLNDLFEVDSSSSFFVRAEGYSMLKEGILPEDVLCVRRDLEPKDGSIVIAMIDSEFTVKRFRKKGSKIVFEAANEDYADIIPQEGQDVQIWGVVTGLARLLKH